MKKTHPILSMFILTTLLLAGSVSAEPRVVVSVAPIHSLVSALMKGIAEPILLLEQDTATDSELNSFQQSRMITADMMIWVGAGLETSMAKTLEQIPALKPRMLTLSNHVPLFVKDGYQGNKVSRQQSRNMSFWYDPKLTIMVVRRITPQLVRLDPEHQEQYLDNEIALIKKLKKLHHEISSLFKSDKALASTNMAEVNRYFSHRFIEPYQSAQQENWPYRTVSNKSSDKCPAIGQSEHKLHAGSELYFDIMRDTARSTIACMENSRQQQMMASIENH